MRLLYLGAVTVLCLVCNEVYAEVDLEFSGTLVADPCVLTIDSEEQVVDFGAIASKTFANHSRSVGQPFTIHLSECDLSLGNSLQVTFRGAEDSDQLGTFAITGEAAGVSIALEDEAAQPVAPGDTSQPIALSEGDTILNYRAYLQASEFTNVKEGEFMATVIFELGYE